MFASMHSTPSSAGPKYGVGVNVPSSHGYAAGPTVPARFSVHMFQKPGFGTYYHPASNVNAIKKDAVGYRPSMPQQPFSTPMRYDERYSPPHAHPSQPPRLNTAPSNLSRSYEPKPVPVSIPAPPPSRHAPNFNIYPGSAQDRFIYEQSQGSKSDLLSTSEFDSQASPTESISSTVTLRGADTPATETSSLEPSPVEPSLSRRNSIVFNGGPSPPHGDFQSPSTNPGARVGAGPAFPPHMLEAMHRTPSESSLDNRERIAVVNAQLNSTSTGSYYSSSPDPSSKPQPRASPPGVHTPMNPVPPSIPVEATLPRAAPPTTAAQQPIFTDASFLHSSPESVHAHVPQPTGVRSRSVTPPQQAPQQLHPAPERPASRHERCQMQPTSIAQNPRLTPAYGSSTPQMRSPSQQANSSMMSTSPPTYAPVEDYFSIPTATPSSRQPPLPQQSQQQQYSPNSSFTNIKYSSGSIPREESYSYSHHDHRQGSASPPAMGRQASSMGASKTSAGAGHHQRYSPPDHSVHDISMRSDDDRYPRRRDDVPGRERRQSNASYPTTTVESAVSYSSSSGSSSGSDSTARGPDHRFKTSSRERERVRDRDRSIDMDRERDRERNYYPPNSHRQPSRHATVYVDDAPAEHQQSTVPFVKSSPPSPPNQPLKYTPPARAPSYPPPSSSPPEKLSSRTRATSMSTMPPPNAPLPPPPSRMMNPSDLSMSSLRIPNRTARHPDLTPSSIPAPTPTMASIPRGEALPVHRHRRMSVISQVSDAGSMATTATATTASTIPVSAQPPLAPSTAPPYPEHQHHAQRSSPEAQGQPEHVHPPTPFRRLSDGDRPVLSTSVGYDLKASQQYPPHQRPQPPVTQQQPYPPHPEQQRRYSDGDSSSAAARGFRTQQRERGSSEEREREYAQGGSRNVRWNEDLICPSPVLPPPKRKGWYNRRGDQLWTNDGMFRPAPPDAQYPPDLDDYPEHGEGWQNEDGIRIDMEHRRVPKMPRRSALKQTAFSAA